LKPPTWPHFGSPSRRYLAYNVELFQPSAIGGGSIVKLESDIKHQKRRDCEAKIGQFCALTIAVSVIIGGAITAIYGHEWAGGVIGVSGIGGIVYTFIHGRAEKQQS